MRTLPKIFLLMLVLLLTVGGGILWWANQPLQLRSSPLDFRVTAGSSLRSAITQMRESGINVDPSLLAMLARLNRADTSIKAGSYAVKTGVTPMQLLNKLLSGKVTQGDLTIEARVAMAGDIQIRKMPSRVASIEWISIPI